MISGRATFLLFLTAISLLLAGCTNSNPGEAPAKLTETMDQQSPALAYADVVATNEAKDSEASVVSQSPTASTEALTEAASVIPGQSEITTDATVVPAGDGLAGGNEENEAEPTPDLEQTQVPSDLVEIPFEQGKILGVPIETVVYMPEEVIAHAIEIYTAGQARGRDSHAFSKLGDSLIANPHFLTGFDGDSLDLGDYDFLQPAIDQFAGSYERYGVGIHAGLHSWGIFDPMWADKNWCQPNESMVACEFRLNNPSVLLILLGSNDSGAPDNFAYQVRKLVEYSIDNGVIPVLVTKADRFEGPENTNNLLIREIAGEYAVPLWDFDLLADLIPNRGLKDDLIHLTPFDAFDYTLPEALATGHGVHNLTALMVLEAIRTQVMGLS